MQQNILILPSVSTLRRVTGRLHLKTDHDNDPYLSIRAKKLNAMNNFVTLVIGEIYLGKRVELSDGHYDGFIEDDTVSQTALCFMIRPLTSKYFEDIVAVHYIFWKNSLFKRSWCHNIVVQFFKTESKICKRIWSSVCC